MSKKNIPLEKRTRCGVCSLFIRYAARPRRLHQRSAGGVAASAAQNTVHAAAAPQCTAPWPASLERLLKCGRGCSLCSHHRNNSSLSDVHSRHVLHTRLRKYVRAFATLVHITEDFQLTSNELENQSRKKLFFTGCKC